MYNFSPLDLSVIAFVASLNDGIDFIEVALLIHENPSLLTKQQKLSISLSFVIPDTALSLTLFILCLQPIHTTLVLYSYTLVTAYSIKSHTFCEIRGSKVVLDVFEALVPVVKQPPTEVDHLIVRLWK